MEGILYAIAEIFVILLIIFGVKGAYKKIIRYENSEKNDKERY